MVGARRHIRPQNRRDQDPARQLQALRSRRRDPRYGREDDVRPAAEGEGLAQLRRAEEG